MSECSFYVCSKFDLSNPDDLPYRDRVHVISCHSNDMVDIPFGNVIFRFRRDPVDGMKFRCLCGTSFSSRQSLYNHVKGSSQWATMCRKPCDIIVVDFHATESNPSIFGEKKDDDRQPVNVWLADEEEIIQANQVSEQWALVAYEWLDDDEDFEERAPNETEDILQAMILSLDALEQRQAAMSIEIVKITAQLYDLRSS